MEAIDADASSAMSGEESILRGNLVEEKGERCVEWCWCTQGFEFNRVRVHPPDLSPFRAEDRG